MRNLFTEIKLLLKFYAINCGTLWIKLYWNHSSWMSMLKAQGFRHFELAQLWLEAGEQWLALKLCLNIGIMKHFSFTGKFYIQYFILFYFLKGSSPREWIQLFLSTITPLMTDIESRRHTLTTDQNLMKTV